MPRRKLQPISWRGEGLTTRGRRAFLEFDEGSFNTPSRSPVTVSRTAEFPSHVRMQPEGKVFPLKFVITSPDSEGQFEAVSRIFDPSYGLQDLIVEDADGRRKILPCVPQQIILDENHDKPIVVPLWAPEPYLESTTEQAETDTIVPPATTINLQTRNEGTVRAIPRALDDPAGEAGFEVLANQLNFATMGYRHMREITYANRSEFPLTGPASGTWLLELVPGGWDTAAIVDVAAITTNSTTTIIAAQAMPFQITVGATAGWDQEGMLLAEPGGGNEEQFEYYIVDATRIMLTARALGGTTAVLHTQPFTIHQSRMMVDGRDIAVFLDGVQMEPEKITLVNMDTASTKIWIELADSPAIVAELAEDIVAGDIVLTFVGDGGIQFSTGDYIVWENDAAGIEQAYVSVVASRDDGRSEARVARQQRNSAAAGATTAGAFIYRAGHHIQIAWNYTKAPVRPTNPNPPLINTTLSTNAQWEWTTAPIWADGNKSPGGWRRILYQGREDVPTLRRNLMSAKTALDIVGAAIRFADIEPTADRPNFDAVEFVAACGIDDNAGDIEYDASVGWPFGFQIIGRDLLGLEEIISTRLGHEAAGPTEHEPPATYANQPETPPRILQALILRCRNLRVTGALFTSAKDETLTVLALDGQDAQSFTLREETSLAGVVIRAREKGASTRTLLFTISAQAPSGAPGDRLTPIWDYALPGAAFVEVCGYESPGFPIVLPAGDYQLEIYQSAGATDLAANASAYSVYSLGMAWEIVAGVWTKQPSDDLWCSILSEAVDNQEDVFLGPRSSEVLTVDDILLKFDANRTPIVVARPEEDAYYFNTVVEGGGRRFVFVYLIRWADFHTIYIQPVLRNILHVVAIGLGAVVVIDYIRQAITPENDPWWSIAPGLDPIPIRAFNGANSEQWTVRFRSTWQS